MTTNTTTPILATASVNPFDSALVSYVNYANRAGIELEGTQYIHDDRAVAFFPLVTEEVIAEEVVIEPARPVTVTKEWTGSKDKTRGAWVALIVGKCNKYGLERKFVSRKSENEYWLSADIMPGHVYEFNLLGMQPEGCNWKYDKKDYRFFGKLVDGKIVRCNRPE